jgi:HEAT repeat protein
MKTFFGVVGVVLCLALAGRGAEVNDLVKQLKDGDAEGRRAAAKALGEGGAESKAAVPALVEALKDRDLFVRRFSAQALGEIGPEAQAAVPALKAAMGDSRKEVQSAAAVALGKVGPSGVEALTALAKDEGKDVAVRHQAIGALAQAGPAARSAVPVLTDLLKDPAAKTKVKNNKKKMPADDLRVDAAEALGSIATASDKEAVEALTALTDKMQKNRALKMAANTALRKIRTNK